MIPFAYDMDLMRPGCVLLQAAMGGSVPAANRFPTESWLTHLTPGMRLYSIPAGELDKGVAYAWVQLRNGAYSR